MSPLKVYKASAGSGKTYALTLEYLKLIFRNPLLYRHILAVTFTNKAAAEMKERILDRLHDISASDPAREHGDRDELVRETGKPGEEVIRLARILLTTILNDYSGFSVGTIDKFFQSVIRAFTRDIGIQPGYNLELDNRRVLTLVVDRLFRELGDDPGLEDWLCRFALERLEEARSWDLRNDIVELGMELFRESFQSLFTSPQTDLSGREGLYRFQHELRAEGQRASQNIRETGSRAMEILKSGGLEPEDFRLKGNSPAVLFRQAGEGEVAFTPAKLAALEDPDKWLNKDATGEMAALTRDKLMPLLRDIHHEQVVLNSVKAVRDHFYTMGILGDLRERIQEYLKENNLFLIADSGRFLRGILGESQVPFIFERTGNRYSHIMLDEFQDTSVFQYENFRHLLEESLSQGHESLVVGDVKQSIYRWRNSDWKILSSELEKDLSHQKMENITLKYNYRSREEIIRFNNTVFQLVPEVLAGLIRDEQDAAGDARIQSEQMVDHFRKAYADAVQQIPPGKNRQGGLVRLRFLQEESISFEELVLKALPGWIDEILDAGILPGEIAILVRTRKEGIRVAGRLLEHARETGRTERYRLVSSESLLLSTNDTVTLLISALRYLVFPGDRVNNALLKYRSVRAGLSKEESLSRIFSADTQVEEILPDSFISRIPILGQMPLFDLIEELIRIFGVGDHPGDLPYIQALQDLVVEVQRRESMSLPVFLEYWDQFGSTRGIGISEHSDAIRILTIHRSKGLEFRAVVVPFVHWEITTGHRKANILWCSTRGTGFGQVPLVPVRYGSDMKETLFSASYYEERMKGYLDNLNLLYVAFTRAVEVLYAAVPLRGAEGIRTVGDLFPAILQKEPSAEPSLGPLSRYLEGGLLEAGRMPGIEAEPLPPDPWKFVSYDTRTGDPLPKLRLQGEWRLTGEEGEPRSGRNFGNLMHLAFSRITGRDDVPQALEELVKAGLLSVKERPELEKQILEMVSRQVVKDWFRGRESVFRERSILCGNGQVVRPDRVMIDGQRATVIDFKFGRHEREEYVRQVAHYMELLREMGYDPVEGFLWYAALDRIQKIEM